VIRTQVQRPARSTQRAIENKPNLLDTIPPKKTRSGSSPVEQWDIVKSKCKELQEEFQKFATLRSKSSTKILKAMETFIQSLQNAIQNIENSFSPPSDSESSLESLKLDQATPLAPLPSSPDHSAEDDKTEDESLSSDDEGDKNPPKEKGDKNPPQATIPDGDD
jgi:seryl-tRNA synthetase